MQPHEMGRSGDVRKVAFRSGWMAPPDWRVLIRCASSDTRCHGATSSVDRLFDYVRHTPEDGLRSAACVQQRVGLIRRNLELR